MSELEVPERIAAFKGVGGAGGIKANTVYRLTADGQFEEVSEEAK